MNTVLNAMYVLESMAWVASVIVLQLAVMFVAPALLVTGFVVGRIARMALAALAVCAPGLASLGLMRFWSPSSTAASSLELTTCILVTLAGFAAAAAIINRTDVPRRTKAS